MRLDLGLLQMELTGRPDGASRTATNRCSSTTRASSPTTRRRNGTELGFHLTATQCQSLREEAVMYYHRYLSLFVLEDFAGVVRDTARNLRVLDLCGKYAVDEQDRLVLEQYRPYIIMMNARAQASIAVQGQAASPTRWRRSRTGWTKSGVLRPVRPGGSFAQSNEVQVLKRFARDIRKKLPVDPIEKLKSQLERAVKASTTKKPPSSATRSSARSCVIQRMSCPD